MKMPDICSYSNNKDQDAFLKWRLRYDSKCNVYTSLKEKSEVDKQNAWQAVLVWERENRKERKNKKKKERLMWILLDAAESIFNSKSLLSRMSRAELGWVTNYNRLKRRIKI